MLLALAAFCIIKDYMASHRLHEFIGFEHTNFTNIFSSYNKPLKNCVVFCWFIFIAVFIFVCLLNTVELLRPEQESIYTWFERSGALVGACAIFIEFKLKLIDSTLDQAALVFEPEPFAKLSKYESYKQYLHWLALAYGIIGTLIWSYGSPFLIIIKKLF
jgi:hypothetical protein